MGAVPVADRADRAGERGDLRRPAAVSRLPARRPLTRRGKKGAAQPGARRAARGGGRRRGNPAGRRGGRCRWPAAPGWRPRSGRSAPGCCGWARRCWRTCWPPTPAMPGRGLTAAPGTRPSSPATGTRTWTRCSARSPSARAWYHCAACGHGFAPRDAQLGVRRGRRMSPGLRKMTARAAAAVPFAAAARLVGELAGITLTGKRAGRRAEADGQRRRRGDRGRAAAIAAARGAAAAARRAAARQAVCRHRRHRRADDRGRDRGPGRQGRGRQGPHPRGQDGRRVHPDRSRRATATRSAIPAPRPTWPPFAPAPRSGS